MELFSEVHSLYYQLMTKILQTDSFEEQQRLLSEEGFKETPFEMSKYLAEGPDSWYLLKERISILNHSPTAFPLTKLEKAWLAAIQQDQKFDSIGEAFALPETEPLFDWQDYQFFDQFASEDSFDFQYQERIQLLLASIEERLTLELSYQASEKKPPVTHIFQPLKLEYSIKNNKFRILGRRQTGNTWKQVIFNCSQILTLKATNEHFAAEIHWAKARLSKIICEIQDERSALERATFYFSNYRKTVERLGENTYQLTIFYEKKDETELLINVLSFGSRMKVVEPTSFVTAIKERLQRQQRLLQETIFTPD